MGVGERRQSYRVRRVCGSGERRHSYRIRRVCGCGGVGKTSVWVMGRGDKVIE